MASEFFARWSSCSLKFSRECDRLPVQFEAKMKARQFFSRGYLLNVFGFCRKYE